MKKQIITTSALPYPNGDLHLGHILEFIQTDIWIKSKNKKNCFYFSGLDTHGTPIMLKALKEKTKPENLITKFYIEYKKDLKNFNINYTNFYTTNSYENEILSRKFFYNLYEKKLINIKNIEQFYDTELNMFLPDRYIVGTCPKCKTKNQYADICNICSSNYEDVELLNPISKLTSTKPIKLKTTHYYFQLNKFKKFLTKWCNKNLSQSNVLNKLKEWLHSELKDWNISRDYPYFGIKIPSEYNKFFYVWMDAPIGYFASMINYFYKFNINIINYISKKKFIKLYHFIGKDIIYFHSLFWVAILYKVKFKLPNNIFVHGFLTFDGDKMSKSNKSFITCKDMTIKTNTDYIRFYIASKLNNNIDDIDFQISDFVNKINSTLIGKFINILNRTSNIIIKNYNSILSNNIDSNDLFYEYKRIHKTITNLYKKRKYSKIIKIIISYAGKINIYIDKEKPWYLHKDKKTYNHGHKVCTLAINLFLILLFYIKPIIPNITKKIENIFQININNINILEKPLLERKIKKHNHLANKLKIKY